MAKVRFNRNFSIGRVVSKIAITVLTLYVGGTIITEIGNVMNGTGSPFYKGLTLIGWTVGSIGNGTATYYATDSCSAPTVFATSGYLQNCITSTSGSGILAVVGIVGIASIVMEFVEFKWK